MLFFALSDATMTPVQRKMRHFVVCLGYHGAGVQSSFGPVLLTFCIREKGSVVRIRTYDLVVEFYSAVSILFVLIVYFFCLSL